MNILLNSEAYWGRLQGTLISEFHFYYKSATHFYYKPLTHLFLIIVPSMLKADLNNFQRLSSLFYLMF